MLGDQEKPWAPHIVCKPCAEHLRQWTNKSRKSLRFAIPMVWREPQDHCNGCYFCAVKTKGISRKNRNSLTYPNLDFAIRRVPHSEELPVPVFEGLPQLESSLSSEEEDVSIDSDNTLLAYSDFPNLFYPRNSFPKESLTTWQEIWIFLRSLLSCWLQGLKKKSFKTEYSHHLLPETSWRILAIFHPRKWDCAQ